MSTYLYDTILTEKFKRWTKDTNITITGPEESRRLFETVLDKQNDKRIQLPLACIRRYGNYTVDLPGKRPLTYSAFRTYVNENGAMLCNAIPITLSYRLDVYSKYFDEADEYMRNFLFNIINYPRMEILIKYRDSNRNFVANILPGQEVVDTSSSTAERLFPGQFTRLSYDFKIDDAYLWDIKLKGTTEISDGLLHIIDETTGEDIVETYL